VSGEPHFALNLMGDGQIRFLEALGEDDPSLVLTVHATYRETKAFAARSGPTHIRCSTMRFDALSVDRLIACLATALGYDISSDINVDAQKHEFEDRYSRVRVIDRSMSPIAIDIYSDSALQISCMNLNFNREDFAFTVYPDGAENLLKEIAPLYGWKLQG
jgi:hypothetical protein